VRRVYGCHEKTSAARIYFTGRIFRGIVIVHAVAAAHSSSTRAPSANGRQLRFGDRPNLHTFAMSACIA